MKGFENKGKDFLELRNALLSICKLHNAILIMELTKDQKTVIFKIGEKK